MARTDVAPLHDWQRHYRTVNAIAERMIALPALLALSTKLLVADIRARFDIAEADAYRVVAIARNACPDAPKPKQCGRSAWRVNA